MKSLDALISYLLEQVALCGKQGAGPSEIFEHVKVFYTESSGLDSDKILDSDEGETIKTINIDRPFLEHAWKWLVNHPECRVENRGQGERSSLSEVGVTNHASTKHEAIAKRVPPELGVLQKDPPARGVHTDTNRTSALVSESADGPAQSQPVNEQSSLPQSSLSAMPDAFDRCLDRSHDADGEARIYVSEERMWHALTGHGVDYSKIATLDFLCLSIIAAAGPKGITQTELVKLSGQDKRSVPKRTQNLFEDGYITKTPVLSGAVRTCICTLKRFVPAPKTKKPEKDTASEEPDLGRDSQMIFRQCFPDGNANLYLLLRNIFDLLNCFKMIAVEDLRRKLGVSGHLRERRILASTLRKLEAVGCVKQVRAQAHGLGDRSRYFRCVKLIREPGDNESQRLCGLSNVDLRFASIGQGENSDSESEAGEDDHVRQISSLVGLDNGEESNVLQEFRRPIPQWTGSGCINNLFYDLIQRAGTLGLSTMDIKNQVLGRLVSRPVENQLSRIVDHWQVSQPPHLRHLAIIRDTAMVKKKTHYIHYTYDNFKKLVENGEAAWEAVSILGGNKQNALHPDFAMDSNVEVDEYGFPDIPTMLFQGRHNDATLSQCVNAIVVAKPTTSKNDPVVRELSDGTYEIHHAVTSRWTPRKFTLKPVIISPSIKADHTPRPKGRPRKVPLQIDLAGELTSAQASKMIQSKNAAIRYQKNKLEKEIAKRIGEGEDPKRVRENIFAMVTAKYLDAREDIPASIKELKVGDMTLSGEAVRCVSSSREKLSENKQSGGNSPSGSGPAVTKYLPSVAAHTQTVPMNPEFNSNYNSRASKPVSARLAQKLLLPKGSEKADFSPKPNGSVGLTYDEQSNLIARQHCGVFVGVDALRARTPGQRGRSRKCRLAVFKSVRLSEFSWFSEEIVTPLEYKDSALVGNEPESGARASSPILSISARTTRKQTSPLVAESSKLSQAEKCFTNTSKSSHGAPSLDCNEFLQSASTGLNVSDQVRMPDVAVRNDTRAASFEQKNGHVSVEPENISQVSCEEKRCTLSGLSHDISCFAPTNGSHSQSSQEGADSEAALHIDKEKIIPLKKISKSQIFHTNNASAEERTIPLCESQDVEMSTAPIILEDSSQIHIETEAQDVADGQIEREPTILVQTSSTMDALPSVSDRTNADVHAVSMQTDARLTKPVTISSGSISVIRKNIIMDIIRRCDGIYSGHKELQGPFIAAWARQSRSGTPDSKTIYTTFRSLVQSGKLRELKFSFQTPQGLMVTKSMITIISISPIDSRVAEMQKKMIACHPSAYIPEGAGILEEPRSLSVYPSRFGSYRSLADLEIEDEVQVRLQHKPLYVTRLEERKAAAEISNQIRQARSEAKRIKNEQRIQRTKFSNPVNPIGASRKVERLTGIKKPTTIPNKDPVTRFNIATSHFDLVSSDVEITYLSSGVDSAEDAGEMCDGQKVTWLGEKRKRALSDGFETTQTAYNSRADKPKRRRLAGQNPMTRSPKRSAHTMRQISTVMDPEHIFHAATGTFSVTFSGLKKLHPEVELPGKKKIVSKRKTAFETEVEDLLELELATGDFSNPVYPEWSFINHQLLQPHQTPVETDYVLDPDFEVEFVGQKIRRIQTPLGDLSVKAVQNFDKGPSAIAKIAPSQHPKISRKRKRSDAASKTRRLTAAGDDHTVADVNTLEDATQTCSNGARPSKLRKVRGPHKQPPMTRDDEERLLAAVVAIRTITGGVERNPDWVLIARLFQPTYSQMYIQKKWTHVLHRHRLQMDQIQANFQEKFAKAYEDNKIPTIDFDHLEDYDWDWLVEWTLENIDTSWDSLQHLPSKRSEFDAHFHVTASTDVNISEYFEIESSATVQRREAVLNKFPYVYPAEHSRQSPSNAHADEVGVARTWIRATLITPAASYEPDLARAKLSTLNEHIMDEALQELLSARLLSQSNKGRLVPGRNYDISDYFLSRLRKKLDAAQFRRAAAFKRELDETFREQPAFIVPYNAGNGDMMAILNMMAFGRITVKPKNPPMEKFGLTDGGYRTRKMDKSRMNFDVEIRKASSYVTGNPIAPIPLPPCQHLNHPRAKIPLWYDIHGHFVPIMWDMLVAATMSILTTRSSVDAADIGQSVVSAELWELELVLDWMVQARVSTKSSQGRYTVAEWWWMCLGNDELAQRSDEHAVQN